MNDEGFHEIQLNGKQLVFLFMAATVVSVVIFLCGVMVGRGVRSQQTAGLPELEETAGMTADAGGTNPARGPETPVPPPDVPQEEAPDSAVHRLLTDEAQGDAPRASASTAPASKPAPPPAPEPEPEPITEQNSTTDGFAVQVAALRDRTDAAAIVKRLADKGYPAYLQDPSPGSKPVYRVQVGRYPTRGEAEKIAARLKSEEQFSPWITR
jgi:DedD protein